ncbi:hypothetical protein JIQ42_00633 [Leishmania sp. Namibia]|uniref:hypothetical protein n=1 Tax=Leishmania sp. Namibia TaxID=2802991 RepID=UPI001B72598B|nr:hypothetical protein JIQ42_00633 [Leishmania sp. Namibia]
MTREVTSTQHSEPAYMSARQRARKNVSGENAARVIMGMDLMSEDAERRPSHGRQRSNAPRNNFSSPIEFFAGPRQPARQQTGVRRNPNGNQDSVGVMLRDEYFMMDHDASSANARRGARRSSSKYGARGSASGFSLMAYGLQARRGEGTARQKNALLQNRKSGFANGATSPYRCRDGLTNNCIVTAPEAPWRCGVRITHPQGPMDAPFFEDNDPRPPREVPAVTGKRHVKPPHKDAKMFGQVQPLKEGEEDYESSLPPCHKASNKANESVDVLNLYCYTPEELNEKPVPYKQLGPRTFSAPDMPPRKPAKIKSINTPAKQEHDVLGTGRWGVAEQPHPRGLARGLCRPPRDTANLFYGGTSDADETNSSPAHDSWSVGRGGTQSVRAGARQPRQVDSQRSTSITSSQGPRRVDVKGQSSCTGLSKKREDPVFDENYRPRVKVFRRYSGDVNLLRYYDPCVDPVPAAPPRRPYPRSNMESTLDDSNIPRNHGRARGEFCINSRSTLVIV